MKLELKHILPYLDSKLKAVDNQAEPDDNIIEVIGFSNTDGNIEVFDQHGNYDIKLSDIKPILRPLSDLTKEIDVNGDVFVPLDVLAYLFGNGFLYFNPNEISKQPYEQIQKLLEWHFDVFGLIEKGLAIDINNLEL